MPTTHGILRTTKQETIKMTNHNDDDDREGRDTGVEGEIIVSGGTGYLSPPLCNCCRRPILDSSDAGDNERDSLLCVVCDLNGCGQMGESPRCWDQHDPIVRFVVSG